MIQDAGDQGVSSNGPREVPGATSCSQVLRARLLLFPFLGKGYSKLALINPK